MALIRTPDFAVGQIPGTATNDSAAAGRVGEYIESVIASGSEVAITSGAAKTITSLSLTAGDWDVNAILYHHPAVTTSYTRYVGSLSLTTDTLDSSAGKFVDFSQPAFVSGGLTFNDVIPAVRFSFASTTSVFLIALGVFSVSTSAGYGVLRARRMR